MKNFTGLELNTDKSNLFFSKGAKYNQQVTDIIEIKPANI